MAGPDPSPRTVLLWIRDYPELQFDGIELYCRSCKKAITWNRKSHIVEHITSEDHRCSVSSTSDNDRQRNFNLDLVEVMVGCNMPWLKLDNPLFRQFMQKCISGQYGNVTVPSESTLRKNYVSPACDNIKQKVSSELNGKYIWVNVNETTNASGLKVVNVLVGGLEESCYMGGHLVTSNVLKTTNSSTVADVVHSSLRTLWSNQHAESGDKLLLFITEAAPYMEAAGRILKETYQHVLHVTCLVHALHKIAETIRECYPNVDRLITNVKEVFLNIDCIQLFRESLPDTPLPPEPILTQCGTWILAASYYYSNFDGIKSVLQQLNPDDALAISEAQQAFSDPTVQKNLEYIHGHFSRIPSAIRELECNPEMAEFTIVDAMNIIFDLRGYIFQLSGGIADIIKQKFESVLKSNPGFVTMSRIVDLLNGKEVDFSTPGLNMKSLQKFTYFKYARIACADIDRNYHSIKSARWEKHV